MREIGREAFREKERERGGRERERKGGRDIDFAKMQSIQQLFSYFLHLESRCTKTLKKHTLQTILLTLQLQKRKKNDKGQLKPISTHCSSVLFFGHRLERRNDLVRIQSNHTFGRAEILKGTPSNDMYIYTHIHTSE